MSKKTNSNKTSMDISPEMKLIMEELKSVFGAKTNVQVIQKALQLSKFISDNANEGHSIVIQDKNNEQVKLMLQL